MPDPLAGLPPRFLRTPEAARFLGRSGPTLEKHRTYRTGPKYRKIGGSLVYAVDDLQASADRRTDFGGLVAQFFDGLPAIGLSTRNARIAICMVSLLLAATPSTVSATYVEPPRNAHKTSSPPALSLSAFIAEASQRFRVPVEWIRAVMRIESGGKGRAVSPKGAIGLMQIMPKTYASLRIRYRLGADPYNPRDNILAGAAYLREMHDRYGAPGFLAAYNAGPARYDEHLATGRPLPIETQAYVDALLSMADATWTGDKSAASCRQMLRQSWPITPHAKACPKRSSNQRLLLTCRLTAQIGSKPR
jgi:soluble lytic murein transglycosylase-like protein